MISVIIPVFNVELYLERCVRSVLINTYEDIEIICINDGSTDSSLKILERMAAVDSRIKVHSQNHQGVSAARNTGLKLAAGEYVAFIDSDDWVHPQYFETLLRCMEHTRADMVVCDFQIFSMDDEILLKPIEHIYYERVSGDRFFKNPHARHHIWGKLFRREDLEEKRFVPDIEVAEDSLYNLVLVSHINNPLVYKTAEPLYFYFQRNNSIVHSTNFRKIILFSEWVAANPEKIGHSSWSWMMILQALKYTLSYRYQAILHKDKLAIRKADKLLGILTIRMFRENNIHIREKVVHTIMALFPMIYRVFRIVDDPTLRDWENSIKMQMIE